MNWIAVILGIGLVLAMTAAWVGTQIGEAKRDNVVDLDQHEH
jgi:hypothetical protein